MLGTTIFLAALFLPKPPEPIGWVNDDNIAAISRTVEAKKDKLEQKVKETSAISIKKQNMEEEVESIKKDLESLDDMFVHIKRYESGSAGNRYAPGNCTWFVKSKRPDIGNFWGNASSWYDRAASTGWNVGPLPKKGAIATTTKGRYGHVAYVKAVSRDRQHVTIEEMNYKGFNVVSSRTVHYSEFRYIYELE